MATGVESLREEVRQRYAAAATAVTTGGGGCGSTTSLSAVAAASFMLSVIAARAGVERAGEDAREGQHVVDLVREVAAPGGDHRRVAVRDVRDAPRGPGWPARTRSPRAPSRRSPAPPPRRRSGRGTRRRRRARRRSSR